MVVGHPFSQFARMAQFTLPAAAVEAERVLPMLIPIRERDAALDAVAPEPSQPTEDRFPAVKVVLTFGTLHPSHSCSFT